MRIFDFYDFRVINGLLCVRMALNQCLKQLKSPGGARENESKIQECTLCCFARIANSGTNFTSAHFSMSVVIVKKMNFCAGSL